MVYDNLSDEELVRLINAGDYTSFAVLVSRFSKTIRYYATKYCVSVCDTDELIQDATLALYTAVRHFEPEKSSFSTFASLCIKRAVNTSVKASQNKKNIPDRLLDSIDELEIADSNSPEKIFFEKENLKSLTDTIKLELSSLEYSVLLSFLSGKSYADISAELGIPLKSVDNALRRIRKKLKSR